MTSKMKVSSFTDIDSQGGTYVYGFKSNNDYGYITLPSSWQSLQFRFNSSGSVWSRIKWGSNPWTNWYLMN